MLSRVADSLFWLSRYTERAETNARLMDVNLQLMLDAQHLNSGIYLQQWESVLFSLEDTKLFYKLHPKVTGDAVVDFVTFEQRNPNSIYSCLALARESSRTVREQISSEMWEQINRMYLRFRSGEARRMFQASSYEFYKWVIEASQLFQGITDATMSHGEGWDFTQLGKFTERADSTSRILDIKYHILLPTGEQVGGTVDTLQWMAVLKSCSALEPYRKHYRGLVAPWTVAEFLIKNQTFPRSILFCVDAVDNSLHEISGVKRGDYLFSNESERLSGKLLADISYISIEEILKSGLHEYMDTIQKRLVDISDAVFHQFCEWIDETALSQSQQQSQSQSQSN
jgi:uncharacterized alpha-E superfamily protein